jgi:tryptophan-rich sensory protein
MYDSNWYLSLNKPPLSPPSSVFVPVWSVLYILMFISLGLYIAQDTEKSKIRGFIYFFIQLFFNAIWSPIFFILQNIGFALLVVIFLDIFVLMTIKEFYKISKISAYLLIPYLIWILFATYLNGAYLYIN